MKKIVLTFGAIAGIIVSIMLFLTFYDGELNFENGGIIGYATMIVALSTIFFGIKSYRDKHQNGKISFGKGFLIGLYITLVASTLYVASWMVINNTLGKDFMNQYQTYHIEKLRESGEPEEVINAQIKEMETFNEMYKNPLVKMGVTYMEILPIGLLITLICATILRRNNIPEMKKQTLTH